jgi:cytochrome oxidase assembly protein ShyY1
MKFLGPLFQKAALFTNASVLFLTGVLVLCSVTLAVLQIRRLDESLEGYAQTSKLNVLI